MPIGLIVIFESSLVFSLRVNVIITISQLFYYETFYKRLFSNYGYCTFFTDSKVLSKGRWG